MAPLTKKIDGGAPQHWADLGCGSGTFTSLLADILPAESSITAIDSNYQQLPHTMRNNVTVSFIQADFEKVLPVHFSFDGIMMANSLHYVQDKPAFIFQIEKQFKLNKKYLLVEYDTDTANSWVPYPLSFKKCTLLFNKAGYKSIQKQASIASGFGGQMYAALIE